MADDIASSMDIGISLSLSEIDEEAKVKTTRLVRRASRDEVDATQLLMALGLIPDPEVEGGQISGDYYANRID